MLTYAYQLGAFGNIPCARPARRIRSLTIEQPMRLRVPRNAVTRDLSWDPVRIGILRNAGRKDFYERLTPLEAILTSSLPPQLPCDQRIEKRPRKDMPTNDL